MRESKGKKSTSVDVLGVIDTKKPERILILDPKEQERRGDKKMVAQTQCEITFDDESNLQKCIKALIESDVALRERPDAAVLWNWQESYRQGMTISFGVAWYDKTFFESRKDAYTNANHAEYFKRFGATPKNFKVSHKLIA